MYDIKTFNNDLEVLQSGKNKRFRNGLKINFIRNLNEKLPIISESDIERQLCCSNVKNTSYNWHYIIPPTRDIDKIQTIINEIQPEFPEINLSIYKYEGTIFENIYDDFNYNIGDTLLLPFNNSDLQKSSIDYSYKRYIRTEKESNYSTTCLTFLYKLFADFCVKIKVTPTLANLEDIGNKFIENKETIINGFKNQRWIYVLLNGNEALASFPTSAIVYENINYKNIVEYIVKFFSVPNIFQYLLNYYVKAVENPPTYILTALYSNKKYRLQPYLIHHFIRASFSFEFDEFFDQYFLIKSKFPYLYFWNIIFLCLFKFNYYYYYWLTSQRLFRFTSKDEINNLLNSFNGDSSLDFFLKYFDIRVSEDNLNKYIELYKEEKFDILVKELSVNTIFYVVPIKSFKKISSNFNLLDYYKVLEEKDNCYKLRGDNYITRWYNKKNFQIT